MSEYGVFAGFYDRLTGNMNYKERADYIRTLLNRYGKGEGSVILDIACGTGSITTELAKSGFDMIGVDASPDMLTKAQEKTYEKGLSVLYLCQDMREIDLYGTVDGAVCTLDSLNHLETPEDIRKTIGRAGLFMNPGGIFIFDVNTIYKHRNVLGNNTFVYDCDDVYCVWQNELQDDDSVQISLDFFEREGDAYYRSSEEFREIACSIENIKEWLREAEFETIDIFDEMTDKPLNDKTQRAVFAARYTGKTED